MFLKFFSEKCQLKFGWIILSKLYPMLNMWSIYFELSFSSLSYIEALFTLNEWNKKNSSLAWKLNVSNISKYTELTFFSCNIKTVSSLRHGWPWTTLAILFRLYGFLALKILECFGFQSYLIRVIPETCRVPCLREDIKSKQNSQSRPRSPMPEGGHKV
jgi:hypothetical protein